MQTQFETEPQNEAQPSAAVETAAPIDYASESDELPRPSRFNPRLIAFIAIIAIPFVAVAYQLVKFNGGIEKHGDYDKIDLKALGFFEFDQTNGTINDVPAKWRAYDGKKVALEGFIFAGSSASPRVKDCQFVYNVAKCCFNGPPQVQERVFAHCTGDHLLPNNSDIFVRLIGTLHVKVTKQDGTIQSIYTLDVEHAEPATQL